MKGVMLHGHGNVLEVLTMGSDVDVLICLHPLKGAEGMLSLTTLLCTYPRISAVR
jgi:hypothetical protein